MTQFACPCLNVSVFCSRGKREAANLTPGLPSAAFDPFFAQSLSYVGLDKQGIITSQPNLVNTRSVGQWTVHTCLSCNQDTHATLLAQEKVVISPQALLCDAAKIKVLSMSENYSQLYKLILPPSSTDNLASPSNDKSPIKSCHLKTVVQSLRQQASSFLLQEQRQVEERVRAYTELQYASYTTLQGKVTRERQSLIELLTRNCQQQDTKMVLPSPFDHFPSPPTSPDNSGSTSSSDLTTDRHEARDETLPKAVLKLSRRLPINQRIANNRTRNEQQRRNANLLSKSSVDTNAIFDMDGVDDDDDEGAAFPISDDEDTDDSTTDEPKVTNASLFHKYASSVPITVPFLTAYSHSNENQDENPTPNDPNQIAASIQALASVSMRDDKEMFGDLPRRRLNTGDLVKSRPI